MSIVKYHTGMDMQKQREHTWSKQLISWSAWNEDKIRGDYKVFLKRQTRVI
jgi:hypothetical protein